MQVIRSLSQHLSSASERIILLITGARQVGKTTLVRHNYAALPYFNLDAPEYRAQMNQVSSFRWGKDIGQAVLDEIQKAPFLLDKIKYAFDAGDLNFSVLTGSSQVLLLRNIRETLAGRVHILELYPLMLSELTDPMNIRKEDLLIAQIVNDNKLSDIADSLSPVLVGETWDKLCYYEDYLIRWGGMPSLLHIGDEKKRISWLKDYSATYLERDLADLVRLHDLEAFTKFQRLSSLRTANLLSYSELARDSGIGTETARRYLEYLRISYQCILLQPYQVNITSSTIRTPKVFWTDNGLLRQVSGLGFSLNSGQLYENYVAAELLKWIKTSGADAKLYFYRTKSGMEIDFLLETGKGLIAIEAKNTARCTQGDFSALRQFEQRAAEKLLAGIVLYRGNKLVRHGTNLFAVPSCRFFGEKTD